jgi:hypothetical protein
MYQHDTWYDENHKFTYPHLHSFPLNEDVSMKKARLRILSIYFSNCYSQLKPMMSFVMFKTKSTMLN